MLEIDWEPPMVEVEDEAAAVSAGEAAMPAVDRCDPAGTTDPVRH